MQHFDRSAYFHIYGEQSKDVQFGMRILFTTYRPLLNHKNSVIIHSHFVASFFRVLQKVWKHSHPFNC